MEEARLGKCPEGTRRADIRDRASRIKRLRPLCLELFSAQSDSAPVEDIGDENDISKTHSVHNTHCGSLMTGGTEVTLYC
jgi:hypothetical protein